ncbi:MAG: substrate-binding domain-containing protein [Kiritimatiellaeota bacterium]|nr:substrate-binding domain-containing protein [Kiritimatiellota bacterium]
MKEAFDRRRMAGSADGRKIQAVCVVLRDYIRKHYAAGEVLMPVRQLAGALGTSLPTVCGALQQLKLAGFLEVNHGERTRIAAAALSPRVGILVPADMTHPEASEYNRIVTHHLLKALREQGMGVSFYSGFNVPWASNTEEMPWNFLNDARCGHLDAVVVNGAHCSPGIALCEDVNIPVVGMSHEYPAYVTLGLESARLGARALLRAGCRRMALIAWENQVSRPAFEREVRAQKGRTVPEWVRTGMDRGAHPSIPGSGRRLFGEIWDAFDEKPDGLVIADDVYVPEVVQAIGERKIEVPAMLRVAAHHNKGNRFVYPFPVTLVENDPERQARELAEVVLVKLGLRPQELPTQRVLKSTVIKNEE